MTANTTKTEGSMSDDNENLPHVTEEVTHPSTVEPESITETASQQESASNFKWGNYSLVSSSK